MIAGNLTFSSLSKQKINIVSHNEISEEYDSFSFLIFAEGILIG